VGLGEDRGLMEASEAVSVTFATWGFRSCLESEGGAADVDAASAGFADGT